ncbi:MAG: adenylate/guanylate cyclase domain-containing protein [Acidimicrobiia bacterium]|nr:adenylate/guanylate cyclase domain-containing protein [Acidimicrobiia bacterium]
MTDIDCQPDAITVSFDGEANLLEALVGAGVPITHLCGGRARCSTCRVRVAAGLDDLSSPTEAEAAMAQRLDFPAEVRLACQATVSAPLTMRRLVLDKADEELASQIGRHGLHGPIGRDIEVAVLFADVAGFTPMAEALPPYDVVHMLNRFFDGASHVIESNGGRVDNYIGDAVLALFGVDDLQQPTVAAIESGLGLLEVARELNHYVERFYGRSFRVRVGVDYGEVVFGLVGAERSARETAIGDVVNVASRLQAANKEVGTEMLVSDSVFSGCRAHIDFGRSFELDLRGKVGRVRAHEVLGVKAPT